MNIRTSVEGKRGCGYRKPGGLYLMGGYLSETCHRLPFELKVCPTCSHGIKPARGWTWIDAVELFAPGCQSSTDTARGLVLEHCNRCVVCTPSKLVPQKEFKPDEEIPAQFGKSGLIWIGEKFYPTPESFAEESNTLGVSRRITSIPRGFILGETWVFFAHRKTVEDMDNPAVNKRHPGIFKAFMPTSIDYIVKGDETEEELESMVKRGITPIKVVHKDTNLDLMDTEPPEEESKVETDPSLIEVLNPRIAKILEKHGHTKLSEIKDLQFDDLIALEGVGPKTAKAIAEMVGRAIQ